MSKVSEIIAICMLMIVPCLIGYLIDQKIGSRFVFTVMGLIFGMSGAAMQLIRLVSVPSKPVGKLDSAKLDSAKSDSDEPSSQS